jgi:hypothetical protein
VLLVDPPRIPAGHVGGALRETLVSGTDAGSELLAGVDLSSLSLNAHAARRLTLPSWQTPVVWSPEGVLLSAGDDGRQRVATLAFEPGESNLPQLPALPILAANLVRWAGGWAPSTVSAGVPFAVDATSDVSSASLTQDGRVLERRRARARPLLFDVQRPGLYVVSERGAGLERDAIVAVNTSEAQAGAGAAVDLSVAGHASGGRPTVSEADWLLAAALFMLCIELGYWLRLRGVPAR